jgi:hypothetical protein
MELYGERDWDIYDVELLVLPDVLSSLNEKEDAMQKVEAAYRDLAPSVGCGVRNVHWLPRVPDVVDTISPVDLSVADAPRVRDLWRKAVARVPVDPGGAVTAARSLLESVCKKVLFDRGIAYSRSAELPQLFDEVLLALSLSPRKQTTQALRKVLGNAQAVVSGVAELRSKLGDAHGQGPDEALATPEQAELAVNLAGAMALFITRAHALRT